MNIKDDIINTCHEYLLSGAIAYEVGDAILALTYNGYSIKDLIEMALNKETNAIDYLKGVRDGYKKALKERE